jgi:hypothetical protein
VVDSYFHSEPHLRLESINITTKTAPSSTYSVNRTSVLWLRGIADHVTQPGILGVTRLVFLLVVGSILAGGGWIFLLSVDSCM